MNRHDRRATRAQARKSGPVGPYNPSAPLDRNHLFEANQREIREAAKTAEHDAVIVLCDSRDPVAREWIRAGGGLSEQQIKQREAPMILGRTIPTFILSVTRELAIDLTAFNSPHVSETIETLGSMQVRVVLIISAGGTMIRTIPVQGAGATDLRGGV